MKNYIQSFFLNLTMNEIPCPEHSVIKLVYAIHETETEEYPPTAIKETHLCVSIRSSTSNLLFCTTKTYKTMLYYRLTPNL